VPPSPADTSRARALGLLAFGIIVLAAFVGIGAKHGPYALDVGYASGLGPRTVTFYALYFFLGTAGTVAIAAALTRLQSGWSDGIAHAWRAGPDAAWIVVLAVLAALVPLAIRAWVTHGAPVVDDESAYQYSAELLARGRLVGDSPPPAIKLAFDRSFMINDGRYYSQYFLGWPALMSPAVLAGAPGVANAIYSALALPAIFLVVRRLTGSSPTARLAGLLYVTSPLLAVGAATQMAHTTCFAALAWLTWAALRTADDDAPWWSHALVGATFAIAFWIRPTSAVGIGAPLVVYWAYHALRRPRGRWGALAACAVPAVVLGAAFLAVNVAQNGSPARTAYTAAVDYARANGWRFTHWNPANAGLETAWWGWSHAFGNAGLAAVRMNAALLGWPCSLVLVPFAWGARGTRVLWASVIWYLAFHLLVKNVGVDVFGPVHYFELAVPLLVLTAVGIPRAADAIGNVGAAVSARAPWRACAPIAVAVFVIASLVFYAPRQLGLLRDTTADVEAMLRAPDTLPGRVVVFTRHPLLSPKCVDTPTWTHWRPNNDPDLANRVLWANHITAEKDREVLSHFPGRTGWILERELATECVLSLVPLADPAADAIAPGSIGGTQKIDDTGSR
jgi:hypothetical protein